MHSCQDVLIDELQFYLIHELSCVQILLDIYSADLLAQQNEEEQLMIFYKKIFDCIPLANP